MNYSYSYTLVQRVSFLSLVGCLLPQRTQPKEGKLTTGERGTHSPPSLLTCPSGIRDHPQISDTHWGRQSTQGLDLSSIHLVGDWLLIAQVKEYRIGLLEKGGQIPQLLTHKPVLDSSFLTVANIALEVKDL